MEKLILTNGKSLDHIGVAAACLCAAHCALVPLIVAVLPILGAGFLVEEQTEWALVLVSVALGFLSLVPAYINRHRRCRPLIFFGIGLCVILMARLWLEEKLHVEIPIVLIGASLITAAHFLNLRLCQTCKVCTEGS